MSDATSSEAVSSDSLPGTPRTIVLCFDGTDGQYDTKNSNVVKFFGLLCKDCPEKQVAYYQAGIGTYYAPGTVPPFWTWLASLLDQAFAWYLDAHIMAGYTYLMDNYRSGDKICLIGFSRGAYTARALAGMLTKVGLLPRDNFQQVRFAYKAYKRTDDEGIQLAAGFKKTFSRDVKVEFIGVWDTVQSTGVLVNRILPFTESNYAIRIFRHALALDEHRSRFLPNLYHRPGKADKALAIERAVMSNLQKAKSAFKRLLKRKSLDAQQCRTEGREFPRDDARPSMGLDPGETQPKADSITEEPSPPTDVLEVWFAGCHCDIGGGNVGDDVEVSLAQITLRWMVEQAIESQCGILFDDDKLAQIGFKTLSDCRQSPATHHQVLVDCAIDVLRPDVTDTGTVLNDLCSVVQEVSNQPSRATSSPEANPEHLDAIAPLFDQLKINKLWWILEIVPFFYVWQDSNGVWHDKLSINLGKGRLIPFKEPKFHHTVRERMAYGPLKYSPRAIYDHREVYV